MKPWLVILLITLPWLTLAEQAQPESPAAAAGSMSLERLETLIKRIDESAIGGEGHWQLSYKELQILVITDSPADRMRIMVPIQDAAELSEAQLIRLLQANFDSALDARYALAKGELWATFIHPLASLSEHEFFSGLAQTLNITATFGTTFSSGALVFGGGDSIEKHREFYQDIMDRANAI